MNENKFLPSNRATKKLVVKAALQHSEASTDRFMVIALWGYFGFGLMIAPFYDTWEIALGVGGLLVLGVWVAKKMLPNLKFYQYLTSLAFGVFMAQFIYQMHGMFEMHFWAFVGSAVLMGYRNWRVMLPLVVFVAVHHIGLSFLHNLGMKEVYFTQLSYLDTTTLVLHIGLAVLIFSICGYWAIALRDDAVNSYVKEQQMKEQIERAQRNAGYAKIMSSGKLDVEIPVEDNDELATALREMQTNLRTADEREFQDRYVAVGIAEIGDVLRQHTNDLEELSLALLQKLCKYLEVTQGGLYLVKDGQTANPYLELGACVAFDRQKFLEQRFDLGEGLVGQVLLEKEPIYLTDVPEEYIEIGSGLGKSRPRHVLIVPIKSNEAMAAVLELASFEVLPAFKIEFLTRVSEVIASTLISVQMNEQTRHLLETSQLAMEQLRAQEEEMRQNVEELNATQEEMSRKERETSARFEAIDNSGIAAVEFDIRGFIKTANRTFLDLMHYKLPEVVGKHHEMFISKAEKESGEFKKLWEDLVKGVPKSGEFVRVTKDGDELVLHGAYSIIRDVNGQPSGVFKLATDITRNRKLMDRNKQQLKAMKQREEELLAKLKAYETGELSK